MQLLAPLAEQSIWRKFANTKISDTALNAVSKLASLTNLYAENTSVTDKGIAQLKTLVQLKCLNITGTHTTANGIAQLRSLKVYNKFIYIKLR